MRRVVEDAINNVYDAAITQPIAQLNLVQKLANRIMTVAMLYVLLILISAESFSLFEGKDYFDSVWWAVVTSTSVGYGDIYPSSIGGRITGMIVMIVSLFMIVPILTAQFAAQLIVNSDAFTHDEQEELKADQKALMIMMRDLVEKIDPEDQDQ